MAALAYLAALVDHGDTWQTLAPQQVQDAARNNGVYFSATRNHERMQSVAENLTSEADARKFSWVWRRVANESNDCVAVSGPNSH